MDGTSQPFAFPPAALRGTAAWRCIKRGLPSLRAPFLQATADGQASLAMPVQDVSTQP